jgi:hypothetical protein
MLQCKKVGSKRTFASIVLIMLILFRVGSHLPIDNPTFESIAKADKWLVDGQPVIALAEGKLAKAYPLAILTRHEIANDKTTTSATASGTEGCGVGIR